MHINRHYLVAFSVLILTAPTINANPYDKVQLAEGLTIQYQGAFRFSTETYGQSRMSYANGPFTTSQNGKDFFIVGHAQHQGIAEFSMPELSKSTNAADLDFAIPKQPFSKFIKNSHRLKNPQKLDRITGMDIIEGDLFVNAVEYYDAPGDNNHTTFIIREPSDLKKSKVSKLLKLSGRAKAAGWISEIPNELRSYFGATYLLGYTNNYAINSRFSIGPSAYVSNLDALAGYESEGDLIPARKIMSFPLKKPIHDDQYNKSRKNNIWTEVSYAAYGFIHPNEKYYVVIGNSGGHDSGIGYKITQNNGKVCGGPCAYDAKDYYNYYWLFSVDDLKLARQKKLAPYKIRPVKVGKLPLPFQPKHGVRKVIGADFDYKNHKLWMLIENVDRSQSEFENAPVMVVYDMP